MTYALLNALFGKSVDTSGEALLVIAFFVGIALAWLATRSW